MTYPQLTNVNDEKPVKQSKFKKIALIFLILILMSAVFSAGRIAGRKEGQLEIVTEPTDTEYGQVIGKNEPLPEFFQKDVNFAIFWQVWNKIQTEYIDRPVPEPQLFYGALMGLVASLQDPYSVFLEPKVSQEFKEELKGRFEGIGAEIAIKNNRLTIVSPLPESPAEKAGLKPGDKVFKIDDFDTTGISIDEAVSRIRGEKGTRVSLTILRESESDLREISIIRDTIKIISVSWQIKEKDDKKIAVIDLSHFNQDTESRLVKIINEILTAGPDGIILDLRGNPGGYIDQAISIASHWVPTGRTVVIEQFADGEQTQHLANNRAEFKDYQTVVLINKGSASASEIVAGALQDHNLATIVGEQSFGKGSVQNLEEYEDGSSVKLTVARWLTPQGHQIDGQGITPDVKVELTEEDWNQGRDPQMEKAIELLSAYPPPP